MKIKILSILSGLAIITIMATSCLKSDHNEFALSTDTNVYAVSIGKVAGKDVPLSIDTKKGRIFNNTPLPYGSDTLINKTIFQEIRTTTGILSRKDKEGNDTIFAYSVDTIDLTKEFEFKVYSMAPDVSKTYTVNIKYYKQDPEVLQWRKRPLDFTLGNKQNLSTQIDNKLYIITPEGKAYTYFEGSSQELTPTGLPNGVTFKSLTACASNNSLYLLGSDKVIYQSSDQALSWEATSWGTNVEEILAISPGAEIFAILAQDNKKVFSKLDLSQDDKGWKSSSSQVPNDFPIHNLSTTFNTDRGLAFAIGAPKPNEDMVVWMSESGLNWVKMTPTDLEQVCPYLEQPHLFYFTGKLYAFDGMQDSIYSSTDGIHWKLIEEKFLLPEKFNKTGASLVIDDTQTLWLLENSQAYIWEGVLNLFIEDLN